MLAIITADFLVVVHFIFIIFVVTGGFLTLKWRRFMYCHLPAALWGAWIEFSGRMCPLTPAEQQLRRAGGAAGYSGTFIEHYLLPIIYPVDLSRDIQLFLGVGVVAVNVVAYSLLISRIFRN